MRDLSSCLLLIGKLPDSLELSGEVMQLLIARHRPLQIVVGDQASGETDGDIHRLVVSLRG